MELTEIINSGHLQAEPDFEAVDMISHRLALEGKLVKAITKHTELVQLGKYYGARRDNAVLAWIELGETVRLHDIEYDTISFIYVKPNYRSTFAVGAFLLALKGTLQNPLVLGSNGYDSVLFAGGEDLVKSLHKSAHFDVSVLDLQTGVKTPFAVDDLRGLKGKTLVFEAGDFPMYHDAGGVGLIYLFQD